MRRISFAFTTAQVRARLKTVTRRLGWATLQPGTELLAVSKGMGLKKGEQAEVLGVIRVVSVRRERLDDLVDPARPTYGEEEMAREGFPGMDPQDFMLKFFLEHQDPSEPVTRIEFEYVDVPARRLSAAA